MASYIDSIRIDGLTNSTILNRIKDVVYTEESSNFASTLDINFLLDTSDLTISGVSPDIYQKLGISISYLGNDLILDDFYIDRDIIKVKSNIEFIGSQAYNYGLGISQSGLGTESNDTTVNIGGTLGTPSGRQTLDTIISLLCSPFNLTRSPSIATHWAGFSNSRFIPVGILEDNYLKAFQRMSDSYGYTLNFVSQSNPSFSGLCYFVKTKTIESSAAILTIDRSDIHKEFTYQVDLTQTAKKFVVLYKNTDPYVMETTDYRISSTNNRVIDVRNENLQEDLTAAIARTEGLINTYNQKNTLVKFSVKGNCLLRVNKTINLTNFNSEINGKYVITRVLHNINTSYTCDVECYKVIDWTLTTSGGGGNIRYTTQDYSSWG